MRALYLDGYGVRLGASKGALVVRGRGGERYVPLSEVDLVVIATGGVSVSSRAMRLLVSAGIEMVVLDHRGMPVGIYYGSSYSRTPLTRRAQYQAYFTPRGARLAAEIAYSKVYNQACVLQEHAHVDRRLVRGSIEEMKSVLHALEGEAGGEAPLGEARKRIVSLEARAARAYWATVALLLPGELGFRGRSQEPSDPVNASLNYGYGILYGLSWRALVLAGLDPYAGYLHVDRSGKPTLSFDYVEMFRAHVVDRPLIRLLRSGWRPSYKDGWLDHEARRRIAGEVLGGLRRRVSGETLEAHLRSYALRLARSLREGSRYRGFRGCVLR